MFYTGPRLARTRRYAGIYWRVPVHLTGSSSKRLRPRSGARKARDAESENRCERNVEPLEPIGLHECRHTAVSLMVDAGLSLERVGDYVGHSSAWMTDKYRHLLEGHEAEAARMLDEYLARANTATRLEQLKDD